MEGFLQLSIEVIGLLGFLEEQFSMFFQVFFQLKISLCQLFAFVDFRFQEIAQLLLLFE